MMKVTINNVEFVFTRNTYGTHYWCATDYNDEDCWAGYPVSYCGHLQVMKVIHYLLDKVNTKQQTVLYSLLKLVSDSYVKSVGEQFARYNVSYRKSLTFSIGKRMRQYQLDKVAESLD